MKSCINQLNGTTKYHFLLFLSVPSFLLSFFSLSLSYPLYYVCLDYCTTRATPKSVPISQHVTCKHVQSHEGFSTLVVESLRQKHCIRRAHVFHGENIDMSGNSAAVDTRIRYRSAKFARISVLFSEFVSLNPNIEPISCVGYILETLGFTR